MTYTATNQTFTITQEEAVLVIHALYDAGMYLEDIKERNVANDVEYDKDQELEDLLSLASRFMMNIQSEDGSHPHHAWGARRLNYYGQEVEYIGDTDYFD